MYLAEMVKFTVLNTEKNLSTFVSTRKLIVDFELEMEKKIKNLILGFDN